MSDASRSAALEAQWGIELTQHLTKVRKPGSDHVAWRRLADATYCYERLATSRLARGMIASDGATLAAALRDLGWSAVIRQRLRGARLSFNDPWRGYAYVVAGGATVELQRVALRVATSAHTLPPCSDDVDLLAFLRLLEPNVPRVEASSAAGDTDTVDEASLLTVSLARILARPPRHPSRTSWFTFSRVPIEYLLAKTWALRSAQRWVEPVLPDRYSCWAGWEPHSGALDPIGEELMRAADPLEGYVEKLKLRAAKGTPRKVADHMLATAKAVASALGGELERPRPRPRRKAAPPARRARRSD